jgi:hypothetical protein
MSHDSELRSIKRRLAQSEGRRIARRNAHQDLDVLLKRIRRELRREFPTISKDGKVRVPVVFPEGQRKCPDCTAYVKDPARLAAHVYSAHKREVCWCGYAPDINAAKNPSDIKARIRRLLAAHFSRYADDITGHVVTGNMFTKHRPKRTP